MAAIIVSYTGNLKWAQTSTTLRKHGHTLYPFIFAHRETVGKFDFGIGPENFAVCPMCNRKIPLATATVDHKTPQSMMVYQNIEIVPNDNLKGLLNNFELLGEKFIVRRSGMLTIINKDTADATRHNEYTLLNNNRTIKMTRSNYTFDIIEVVRNNLSNLQYMCHSCNAKKGDR